MATVFTNVGKQVTTNRVKGSGTEPSYVGWGSGAGTAAITDTTLFSEILPRTLGTSTQVTTTTTNGLDAATITGPAPGGGVVGSGIASGVNAIAARLGTPMTGPGVAVANHSSWLDILVLNAAMPVFFVSKAEVAGWPGINILTGVIERYCLNG